MQTIWKKLTQFPIYSISNFGDVKNDRTGRIIKPHQNEKYVGISLVNTEGRKTIRLHRLIAETFIPNPENKSQVNHKDRDRLNNSISNLEWVSPRENIRHTLTEKVYENKNFSIEEICQIIEKYKLGKSAAKLSIEYKTPLYVIRVIVKYIDT